MKTNFKDYLKEKNAQKSIDDIAEKYADKKIMLYGIDLLTGDLFRNYDLQKLNIIGIADRSFQNDHETEYYGYKKFTPDELLKTDFDLLLITTYDDIEVKEFLKKDLLKDKKIKFKIKTLIKMNLFEYIKALMNGDL